MFCSDIGDLMAQSAQVGEGVVRNLYNWWKFLGRIADWRIGAFGDCGLRIADYGLISRNNILTDRDLKFRIFG